MAWFLFCTISSGSQFRPPHGLTESRFRSTGGLYWRSVVHSSLRASCTCPKRLAAGSVDSLIGRLRAVFNNLGRLNDSNPVAHPLVKDYLKFVRQKQAGLAITPVHAVPLFFDKFRRLIAFLRGLLLSHMPLSRSGKYILVRLCLTACRLDLLSPSINYAAP